MSEFGIEYTLCMCTSLINYVCVFASFLQFPRHIFRSLGTLQQTKLNISVFRSRFLSMFIHYVLLQDMPNSFIISSSGCDSVSVWLYWEPIGVAYPPGLLHMALCPRNMLL